jgi:hypothetical protein
MALAVATSVLVVCIVIAVLFAAVAIVSLIVSK